LLTPRSETAMLPVTMGPRHCFGRKSSPTFLFTNCSV